MQQIRFIIKLAVIAFCVVTLILFFCALEG